jgi:peptide/nickel transport system ATP-binding protein
LERSYGNRLPGQLSGGELQRVAIARAFAADPDLILCDEITSALDVSLRASMIDLLERLREERGTAYLFVSHELDILRTFADRIAVIREGRIVETGRTAQIFTAPQHQATKDLLAAAGLRHPRMAPTEEKMRQQAVTGRHRLRRRH